MAISKKHSRKIVVDDVEYVWSLPKECEYWYGGFYRAVVQLACTRGQILILLLPFITITPKIIATNIRCALQNGWQPTGKGTMYYQHKLDFKFAVINKINVYQNAYVNSIKLYVQPNYEIYNPNELVKITLNYISDDKVINIFNELNDKGELVGKVINNIYHQPLDKECRVFINIEGLDNFNIYCGYYCENIEYWLTKTIYSLSDYAIIDRVKKYHFHPETP